VTVLRRQRPGQPRLFAADRLLWVWLYRIWPKVVETRGPLIRRVSSRLDHKIGHLEIEDSQS
jgi:hypothetical protein